MNTESKAAIVTKEHVELYYKIRQTHFLQEGIQLVADAQARAVQEEIWRADAGWARVNELTIERDQLREEVEVLIKNRRDWAECKAKILQLETELANTNTQRDTYIKENARLSAEVERLTWEKHIKEMTAKDFVARAEHAEAEVEHWKREEARNQQIIETIEKMLGKAPHETPYDAARRLIDRAERAEAELAKERARLDWLNKQEWTCGIFSSWPTDKSRTRIITTGGSFEGDSACSAIDAAMKEDAK